MVFGIDINYFVAMMLIAAIYFFMTIIPTIALTEIGVRDPLVYMFFNIIFEALGFWSPEIAIGVVSASSMLWSF